MVQRQALILCTALSLLTGAALAAPQGRGQQKKTASRPVLIGLSHPRSVWIVGAYDARQGWLDDKTASPYFRPDSTFSIFSETGPAGTVTLVTVEDGDVLGGYFAPTRQKAGAAPAVALLRAARPVVRRPRKQSLENPLYREAAAAPLKRSGLSVARARLTQHLRVDLNGDGVEEVLLSAHSRDGIGSDLRASRNDYSLAALRYVSGGKTTLVPLAMESYAKDQPSGSTVMSRHEFIGCVDITGDGRLEIVLYSRQFEHDGVEVFTFDGKTARRVLSADWGV